MEDNENKIFFNMMTIYGMYILATVQVHLLVEFFLMLQFY